MKNLTLIFSLLWTVCQGQSVSTPTVLPQSPAPSDSVQIIIETITPNQGHKLARSFTVQKTGLIVINICNYDGMLTAIDQYVDTFQVGQLPAGNYSIQVNYSISWDTELCIPKMEVKKGHAFTVQTVTGLTENTNQELKIYPNPATRFLHVETDRTATLEILDMHGRVVKQQPPQKNTVIDITSLPAGIYFLRAPDGQGTKTSKIVLY